MDQNWCLEYLQWFQKVTVWFGVDCYQIKKICFYFDIGSRIIFFFEYLQWYFLYSKITAMICFIDFAWDLASILPFKINICFCSLTEQLDLLKDLFDEKSKARLSLFIEYKKVTFQLCIANKLNSWLKVMVLLWQWFGIWIIF